MKDNGRQAVLVLLFFRTKHTHKRQTFNCGVRLTGEGKFFIKQQQDYAAKIELERMEEVGQPYASVVLVPGEHVSRHR